MAGSVNKVILIGNLGKDPEIRSMSSGKEVANLTVATSESWKDKMTGERKEKTEWHRIVVFNEGLVTLAKNYLRKGSKVYIEGALQTRKWTDQSGQEKYATEIVLQGYNSNISMLDGKREGGSSSQDDGGYQDNYASSKPSGGSAGGSAGKKSEFKDEPLEDEIPF